MQTQTVWYTNPIFKPFLTPRRSDHGGIWYRPFYSGSERSLLNGPKSDGLTASANWRQDSVPIPREGRGKQLLKVWKAEEFENRLLKKNATPFLNRRPLPWPSYPKLIRALIVIALYCFSIGDTVGSPALPAQLSKTTGGTQMRSGKDYRGHGYFVPGRTQIRRDLS